MKKLLSLTLLLSLAVFVVACDDKSDDKSIKKTESGSAVLAKTGEMPDGDGKKTAEKAEVPTKKKDEGTEKKAETPPKKKDDATKKKDDGKEKKAEPPKKKKD